MLIIAWSLTLCVIILRSGILPRWLGAAGLAVSMIYLLNQGDILATALPGFPVWDLAGLLGSTGWGLWVAALGACFLVRSARRGTAPLREVQGSSRLPLAQALTGPPRTMPSGAGVKPSGS